MSGKFGGGSGICGGVGCGSVEGLMGMGEGVSGWGVV